MSSQVILRADEVSQVSQWLEKDEYRIIAIVGPSGIGKSWLIQEVKNSFHKKKSYRWLEPEDGSVINLELPERVLNRELIEKIGDAAVAGTVFTNQQHVFLPQTIAHGIDYATLAKTAIVVLAPIVRSFLSRPSIDGVGSDRIDKAVLQLERLARRHKCVLVLDPHSSTDSSNSRFLSRVLEGRLQSITIVLSFLNGKDLEASSYASIAKTLELDRLTLDDARLLLMELHNSPSRNDDELRDIVKRANGLTRTIVQLMEGAIAATIDGQPSSLKEASALIKQGIQSQDFFQVESATHWVCENSSIDTLTITDKMNLSNLLCDAYTFLRSQVQDSKFFTEILNRCARLSMELDISSNEAN